MGAAHGPLNGHLLCLVDDGRLHKAVITRRGVRIIEEIQLFPPEQPVLELLLDSTQARAEAKGRPGDPGPSSLHERSRWLGSLWARCLVGF